MAKGVLSKVMKYELSYLDGCGDFQNMQKELWTLQRQTREILNRTIQIAYHWDYTDREHYKKTGQHLDVKSETGYKRLDGYIYDELKETVQNFASVNVNATIQKAWAKYKSSKADVLRGDMSLPSYKSDQPLVLHAQSIKLSEDKDGPVLQVTLFSNAHKKACDYSNVRFAFRLHDATQRAIFKNVLSGEYGLGQSQIVYKRPKWFLYLTYNFSPEQHGLDPDKILGVDLGESIALYASSLGEYGSLRIEGGEVTAFAKQLEARKRSLQKQATHCGEGRVGHGTKARVSDVYKAEDKITRMQARYNKVSVNVENIASSLEGYQAQLLKDVAMFDRLYDQNSDYFHQLTLYIIAGDKKLKQIRENELKELMDKAAASGDAMDAQKANDLAAQCDRFEKKLYDLKLTRQVAIQMAPQIRLLQNNDSLLVERIQSTLSNTLPLWKSQMVLALGMHHSQEALKAQTAVTDMTNELLKQNAQALKIGTIQTAKEAERGIIDIETLIQTNQDLIDTINDVMEIQSQGHAKRIEAEKTLYSMEAELKKKLLSTRI